MRGCFVGAKREVLLGDGGSSVVYKGCPYAIL